MKMIKISAWIIILTFIQCIFAPYFRIAGACGELLFVFSLCIAYQEPKYYLSVSVICGLLAGSIFGGNPVFYLVLYTVSAFAVSIFSEIVYTKLFLPIVPITLLMTFLENSIFFAVNKAISMSYGSAFVSVILPIMLCNTLAAVIIFFLVKKTVCK